MNENDVFVRNPQVIFQSLGEGEEGVLLHLETADYYSLNPLGLLIWRLLDQGAEFEDIVEGIRQAVDSTPPSLRTDIEQFLSEMLNRGLICQQRETD